MSTKDPTVAGVLADLCEDLGLDAHAIGLRSPYAQWLGQRIAVYGPNYIWRGVLTDVTDTTITLDDVWQVYETGDLTTSDSEGERFGDRMVIERNAICNAGPTPWS